MSKITVRGDGVNGGDIDRKMQNTSFISDSHALGIP